MNYKNLDTRQHQYQSRFGVTGSSTAIGSSYKQTTYNVTRPPVLSQHTELFIAELQCEVVDMKNRQKDIGALREQFKYLQEQYKNVQIDMNRYESDSKVRIAEDSAEVDRLIRELD